MSAPDSAPHAAVHTPASATVPIQVAVPNQLRELAHVAGDVVVDVAAPVTVGAVVDALEIAYPMLAGTIRDRATGRRRAMIRIYAAGEDYSDTWAEPELPAAVVEGREPLRLVGAIAGG
jgi:sulfur-carrier protein